MNVLKTELEKLQKTIKKGNDYLYEQWYQDNSAALLAHYDKNLAWFNTKQLTYGEFCHNAYSKYCTK